MSLRNELWTFLIVTVVAALIWLWAAGETRDKHVINFARVQFVVPEPSDWDVEPKERPLISLIVEGTQIAVQSAEGLLRRPLKLNLPPVPGRLSIDTLERLRQHEELAGTGVTVVSVEPATLEVDLQRIEERPARIKAVLPGVTTEGEVMAQPVEVQVAMPERYWHNVQNLHVEAYVDRSELDRREPGVKHTIESVPLRVPESVAPAGEVSISPPTARLTFTIRSRTREVRLDSVRVQLASPPEDRELYVVEVEPKQLENVTITADADLVRRIESRDESDRATVVAVVHLGSREQEQGIESKRVSYFLALVPDRGTVRGEVVKARVGESTEPPLIKLRITRRPGT